MNRIISLSSFKANPIQTLRAGSLLVQQIVQEEFDHSNSNNILDFKKIGIIASERMSFSGENYFCLISALCEGVDFSKMINLPVYDYNEDKTIVLKSKKATEIIPVLRVAFNEEKDKILLLSDNIKFDFFSFNESSMRSATLFFQLISNPQLLKQLSGDKVSKIEELPLFREYTPENSFRADWRKEFIEKQKKHLRSMQNFIDDVDLLEYYEELLRLELNESSI